MGMKYNPLYGEFNLVGGGSSGGGSAGSGAIYVSYLASKEGISLPTRGCPVGSGGNATLSIPFPGKEQWTLFDPENLNMFTFPEENVCYVRYPSIEQSPIFTFVMLGSQQLENLYTIGFNWNGELPSDGVNAAIFNNNSIEITLNNSIGYGERKVCMNQLTYSCGTVGGNIYPPRVILDNELVIYCVTTKFT